MCRRDAREDSNLSKHALTRLGLLVSYAERGMREVEPTMLTRITFALKDGLLFEQQIAEI